MTQLEIAARLQQLRRRKSFLESRDVTQAEVAAEAGLSVESFSRYENGKRAVPEKALQALARYYGVTPAFIRYGVDALPTTGRVSDEEIDAAKARLAAAQAEPLRAVAGGRPRPRPRKDHK